MKGVSVQLGRMNKAELISLRRDVLRQLHKRFWKTRRKCKYGTMYKAFRDPELLKFLQSVTTRKYRVIFQVMGLLGLRIGEASQLRYEQIDWEGRRLFLTTEKTGVADALPLYDGVYRLLERWCQDEGITKGPLFPSERDPAVPVSAALAAKRFSQARARAGLDMVYAPRDGEGKQAGQLRRLSSHSLRHYFITKVHNTTGNLRAAQLLARHTNIGTTQRYIHIDEKELREAVEESFK